MKKIISGLIKRETQSLNTQRAELIVRIVPLLQKLEPDIKRGGINSESVKNMYQKFEHLDSQSKKFLQDVLKELLEVVEAILTLQREVSPEAFGRSIDKIQAFQAEYPDKGGSVIDKLLKIFYPKMGIERLNSFASDSRQQRVQLYLKAILEQYLIGEKEKPIDPVQKRQRVSEISASKKKGSTCPPFKVNLSDIDEIAKRILRVLSGGAERSETEPVAQYNQVVVRDLGVSINATLFQKFIPMGPEGGALDKQVEKIKNKKVCTAFKRLVQALRDKVPLKDEERFEEEEKRLGEVAAYLAGKTLTEEMAGTVTKFIDQNIEEFKRMPSFKQLNLKLLSYKTELDLILEERIAFNLKDLQFIWLRDRIITGLQMIGVNTELMRDMSYIKAACRKCLEAMDAPIDFYFLDRDHGEAEGHIELYKEKLVRHILRADDMFGLGLEIEGASGKPLMDLIAKSEKLGHVAVSEDAILSLEYLQSLVEGTLVLGDGELSEIFSMTSEDVFSAIDTQLKSKGLTHGLLGELARLGKADLFRRLKDGLCPKPSVDAFLVKDDQGHSLLEYAVLGGSVDILMDLDIPGVVGQEIIRGYVPSGVPSLVGLAAESGNKVMLENMVNLVPGDIIVQALTQEDASGNTPLMRAVMSKSPECVAFLMETLKVCLGEEAVSAYINQANREGQTELTLAASSNVIEAGEMLLRAGANIDYRVPSSGLNILQIAGLENHIEFMRRSIQVLDEISGDERKGLEALKNISFWLARFNGGALKELLLGLDPSERQKVLELENGTKSTVAHWIARYNGVILKELLCDLDAKKIQEILELQNYYGKTVAHWLVYSSAVALKVLLQRLDPAGIQAILSLKDESEDGTTVAHTLMRFEVEVLKELLRDLDFARMQAILELKDEEEIIIVHEFARCHSVAFKNLVLGLNSAERRAILGLKDERGKSVAYTLIGHNMKVFKELFLEFDAEERKAMLGLEDKMIPKLDKDGYSVVHLLALNHGLVLKELFRGLNSADIKALLRLGSRSDAVAHLLAKCNGGLLKDLLLCLDRAERKEILQYKNIDQIRVVYLFAKHNGVALKDLLLALDPAERKEILGSGSTTVAYWLAQCNVLVLKELLLGLKDDKERQAILGLADENGNTVAHFLAQNHGQVLKELLLGLKDDKARQAILGLKTVHGVTVAYRLVRSDSVAFNELLRGLKDDKERQAILELKNDDDATVAYALAQYNGGDLKALLLSVEDQGLVGKLGGSTAHFLAQNHGQVLKNLLLGLKDDKARQAILGLKTVLGVTVAHWLVRFDRAAFNELLRGLDPAERQVILRLANESGTTVAHWLARYNGADLKDLLLGLEDDKARHGIQILAHASWLAQHSGEPLKNLLPDLVVEEGQSILGLADENGNTVAHWLARHNGVALKDLLLGLSFGERQAILGLKNRSRETVTTWFVKSNSVAFRELLVKCQKS